MGDDLNLVDMDGLDATSGDEEEVKGGQPPPRDWLSTTSVLPLFWRALIGSRSSLVVDAQWCCRQGHFWCCFWWWTTGNYVGSSEEDVIVVEIEVVGANFR